MTTRYTTPIWGYIAGFETAFAETPSYGAGDTGLKMGTLFQDLPQSFPAQSNEHSSHGENNSVEVTHYGGKAFVRGTMRFGLLHCIPCYIIMGKSTNTNPSYEQHVITKPTNKTDAIKSMCMYYKVTGSSNLILNAIGAKIDQLDIIGNIGERVYGIAAIKGSRFATGGTELTADPVHPTGASTTLGPYFFGKSEFEYPTNTDIAIMQNFRISIKRGLKELHTDRATNRKYPEYVDEGPKMLYEVTGSFIASEKSMIDDVIAQTTREVTIKLERDTNDYAYFKFTNCFPEIAPLEQKNSNEGILVPFALHPESLEITERNTIVGATYYA